MHLCGPVFGCIALGFVFMAALPGCVSSPAPATKVATTAPPAVPPPRTPLLINEIAAARLAPAFEVIAAATTVESYRINPDVKITDAMDRSAGIVGYPIIEQGPNLNAGQVRRLASFVRDPGGYGGEVWCGAIEPGVAFRFRSRQGVLTILVCFRCKQWQFWLDGEKLGGDTFVGLQPMILALAREAFPQDKTLAMIAVAEQFGRWYEIAELRGVHDLAQRSALLETWHGRIQDAVGDPEQWRTNGGSVHNLISTPEPSIVLVVTRQSGHDAIQRLPGIADITPPR